jgi:acyl-CoA reductase-like NAD-dependent aldehyde dehydrogenase
VAWGDTPISERVKYLYAARKTLLDNYERMISTIVAENGKPRTEAQAEIAYIADMIGFYGKNAKKFLSDRKVLFHLLLNKKGMVTYHPYGVVGAITPWNYPLILGFGDAVTALLAGNAVIIKPSEVTPLTVMLMAELFEKAGFPKNVLQVVTGLGDTGGALIDEANAIAFTGSVPTGRKVMERAAKTLKPVLLELGGKDPMIVLQDADLKRAVNGAVIGGLFNAGQTCISVEALYVEAPIFDQFVDLLVKEVQKLRVGQETGGETVDIGPLTMPRQLEIVERQIEDARAKGAKILTGGKRRADLPGLFYEPTVITDVTDEMLLMQEETFGPVLPVIKVSSAEEAIRISNRSQFGLSSSIWTRDKARGLALARKIEAGSSCVNDVLINYLALELPLGGIKSSGIGYRHGGADGIRHFTRTHSILIDRFGLKREFFWFPYNRRVEKLVGKGIKLLFRR